MNKRRFNFTDDYERSRAPLDVWLTRSVITSALAGIAAALLLLGYVRF